MRVVGIDPGSDGGLLTVEYADGRFTARDPLRMPWAAGTGKHQELQVDAIVAYLATAAPGLVVLEAQSFRPGDQARAFGIGRLMLNYGELRGALKAVRVPYREVPPALWQRKLFAKVDHPPLPKAATPTQKAAAAKAKKARTKAAVLAWAKRTYPGAPLVPAGCRVPHEGVVDALGLAHYGLLDLVGGRPEAPA